jgi:hypothetical protein
MRTLTGFHNLKEEYLMQEHTTTYIIFDGRGTNIYVCGLHQFHPGLILKSPLLRQYSHIQC